MTTCPVTAEFDAGQGVWRCTLHDPPTTFCATSLEQARRAAAEQQGEVAAPDVLCDVRLPEVLQGHVARVRAASSPAERREAQLAAIAGVLNEQMPLGSADLAEILMCDANELSELIRTVTAAERAAAD